VAVFKAVVKDDLPEALTPEQSEEFGLSDAGTVCVTASAVGHEAGMPRELLTVYQADDAPLKRMSCILIVIALSIVVFICIAPHSFID